MPSPTEIQRRVEVLGRDERRLREYLQSLPSEDYQAWARSAARKNEVGGGAVETLAGPLAAVAAAPLISGAAGAELAAARGLGGAALNAARGDAGVGAATSAARAGLGAARGLAGAAVRNPIVAGGAGILGATGLVGSMAGGGSDTREGEALAWLRAPVTQGYGPTDTKLDGSYGGYANFNKGNDYGVPVGTPIDAISGGEVIAAGDQGDGWGISVKVRDAEGYIHNYGHLSSANVQVGQQITAGTFIGASGNTGKSTGPHLSYDVQAPDGQWVDPSPWVGGEAASFGAAGGPGGGPQVSAADQVDQIVQAAYSMMPRPEDYESVEDYVFDFQAWQTTLTDSMTVAQNLRLQESGLMVMPDGNIAGIDAALSSTDPAIRQWAQQKTAETKAVYTQLLDDIGLSQFNTMVSGVESENARLNSDFANQIDRMTASTNYDRTNVDRAVSAVNRILEGQAESRQRASLITDTQLAAAPWATGGKTAFGFGDLGAGIDTLARQAGIRPGQPLINFPGSMRIDPAGIMQAEDISRGVAGALPLIPGLTTTPGMLPGAPQTAPIPQGAPASRTAALIENLLANAPGGDGSLGSAARSRPGITIDALLAGVR